MLPPVTTTAQVADPNVLLDRALRKAELYNWSGAAEDFAAAEKAFFDAGDARNALLARLGRTRAVIERDERSLPVVSADLADELETNTLLKSDLQLRMYALIVKGDIDGEIDTGSMRSDWEQVHALAKQLGDTKWQFRSLGQLGMAAFYDGDTDTASKNVGIALQAAKQNGDVGAQIRFMTVLAIGFAESRVYEQSIPLFEQAAALATTVPEAGYPFAVRSGLLGALVGMKEFARAKQVAEEMLTRARQEGRASHEANALARIATIQLSEGDSTAAAATLSQASSIAEGAGLLRSLARIQALAAQLYVKAGDLVKAEELSGLATASTQASGDLFALPQRLAELAGLKARQGKHAEANDIYDRAETFIDAMIGKASTVLQKTALVRAASEIYSRHFSLVAEHIQDPTRAYAIIEQVRGRAMTDVLMSGPITSPEGRLADRKIARLRLKLMSVRSNAEVRRLRDEIFMAEQARRTAPGVTLLKKGIAEPIELPSVQQTLPDNTVLLEYVLADERSYCLVISRRIARIVPLASKATINQYVNAYLTAVKAKQRGDAEARQLYIALLQPIGEVSNNSRLIVVRDGLLHLAPFDAFVTPSGDYVVARKSVTYSPSATAFCLLFGQSEESAPRSARLLAVGGIPYTASGLNRTLISRGRDRAGFADLPSAPAELEAASLRQRSSGTKRVLTGRQATEAAFKALDLAAYSTIHLAVHGVADPVFPDRAALILLSDPAAGEDGLLQASEIAHLRLNAGLVTLSACDTAVGPLQGQEGIATISRAFLIAGARTVLSTLWQVDDSTSLFLMRRFYTQLAADRRPDEALREAKLHFLREFGRNALPYHWAAYTLEGAAGHSRHTGVTKARLKGE